MKLHLGCGTVYLKGYVNIDMKGVSVKDDPKLKKHNETTVDKYFKYPFRKNKNNDCYDVKEDITKLKSFKENTVDEILAINVFEHIERHKLLKAVKERWYKILKPGGKLIIGVPEIVETATKLIFPTSWENFEEVLNWVYCHQKTKYDSHKWGYTPEYLTYLLQPLGFKFIERNDKLINKDAPYPFFINIYEAVK